MESIDENVLTSQCEIMPMDDSDEDGISEIDIANPYASFHRDRKIQNKMKPSNSFVGAGLRINTQSSETKRNQLSRNIYAANKL